jgi:hypothetical protein
MNIHSKFLVHWTGKDIENKPEVDRSQLYVERLLDYYQNGLFLKRTDEDSIRKIKIKNLVRLCFSEIRLSQTRGHANKYGKLGIGFTRKFIINRGGRPAIYIPFEAKIGLLDESLKQAYEESKGQEKIQKPIIYVLTYIKRMWDESGEEHYDEMEWRIVHDENPNDAYIKEDKMKGVYRFIFAPSDIKIIIFPDEKTKKRSFNDETIKEFIFQHTPITVTLDDCDNF